LDRALDQTELALEQENNEPAGYRLPAGLAERQALREQVKAGLRQLADDGRNHPHPVDPEARRLKVGGVAFCLQRPSRNWLAALPKEVRALQNPVAAVIKRDAGRFPYWPT
jgi:hypothetical protein